MGLISAPPRQVGEHRLQRYGLGQQHAFKLGQVACSDGFDLLWRQV